MRVIDHITKSVRNTATYNRDVQAAPACILWPDSARQWENAMPRLLAEVPELFILGDYCLEERTGPAIWLRCVLANQIASFPMPEGVTPIFYLPGVGRPDLRAVDSCPEELKPLAELQYRGVIWSQANGKDWTILALLKSEHGGMGLDIAQDKASLTAMQLALPTILDEELDLLRYKHLDKDYFHSLLTGGDPIRDLLRWLDEPEVFRADRSEVEWRAFVELCQSQLGFSPERAGVLVAANNLAERKGAWLGVWERFNEAPRRYSHIPEQLRKGRMPIPDLFSNADSHGGWPQWNEEQEVMLRNELLALADVTPDVARKRLVDLDMQHAPRRALVWARLGAAPLAKALEHLKTLAETTTTSLAAGTWEDLLARYNSQGWKADNVVLLALAELKNPLDIKAVSACIRTTYAPWAEEAAHYVQQLAQSSPYPGNRAAKQAQEERSGGECVIFVDGLRFDVAKRLAHMFQAKGFTVKETPFWVPLPSVTATGKPAVSPVQALLKGSSASIGFAPQIADSGQEANSYHLRKLLSDLGWQVGEEIATSTYEADNLWYECGNIDQEGHFRGSQLASYISDILESIAGQVDNLLTSGYQTVKVVTDHGWLLLPEGLPKVSLPKSMVDTRWSRCAVVKEGATTAERLYPWYWDEEQWFALASGISCYRDKLEFAHGGLSLQECLTLQLTISKEGAGQISNARITDVKWRGLRCSVAVEEGFDGAVLDIRREAGNAATTIAFNIQPVRETGVTSLVVEDEDLIGKPAYIVLLNANGQIIDQYVTLVGGEA